MTSSITHPARGAACIGALLVFASCTASAQEAKAPVARIAPAGANVIEMVGNEARGVRPDCKGAGPGMGSVNINSVNVSGRALEGETIVISGHNEPAASSQGKGCSRASQASPGVNVNSVNIR